ncbi:MAG: hypothetical protein C0497_05410 [Gemmatimonas sp.]|nr:hypothetical protein [Gemmatimonas sp.]
MHGHRHSGVQGHGGGWGSGGFGLIGLPCTPLFLRTPLCLCLCTPLCPCLLLGWRRRHHRDSRLHHPLPDRAEQVQFHNAIRSEAARNGGQESCAGVVHSGSSNGGHARAGQCWRRTEQGKGRDAVHPRKSSRLQGIPPPAAPRAAPPDPGRRSPACHAPPAVQNG